MQEFISIYPIDKILGNLFHIRVYFVNALSQKIYESGEECVVYCHIFIRFGCHLVSCDDHIWITLLPMQVMLISIRDLKALQSNCVSRRSCTSM
jgi:hypothetical protein